MVSATARSRSALSRTSPTQTDGLFFVHAAISEEACSRVSLLRAIITTCAPSADKASADARPKPLLAAVTRATRPSSLCVLFVDIVPRRGCPRFLFSTAHFHRDVVVNVMHTSRCDSQRRRRQDLFD